MANFSLLAKLGLDSKAFQKGLQQAESRTSKFKNSARNAFLKVAGGIAAAGLGKKLMQLALDAEETADMFNTVLGGAAEKVNEKIQELKKTIPATTEQLQNSIATIASMGESMGMTGDAAANFAVGMTKLSADLASFKNLTPEEMFTKMAAAITGEFEPLKRLGIVLNMAAVEQEAFSLGLIKTKDELTAQAKAVAVQSLVLKQMGDALGNAAQTQDSAANQTKFFKARIEELGTQIGQKLRPLLIQALVFLNQFADFFEENKAVIGAFTKRLIAYIAAKKALAVVLPVAAGAMKAYQIAAAGAAIGTTRLAVAVTALKLKIQGLLASTGVGILVVILGELGVRAINSAMAVDEATDSIGNSMEQLEKDIADTIATIEQSTAAAMSAANANRELGDSAETAAQKLEREADALQHIRDQVAEAFRKRKEYIDQTREMAIRTKELQALQARSKGQDKLAQQLEKQVELMKTTVEFANRYNMSLKAAFQLASKLDENKNKPTDDINKIDRGAGGPTDDINKIDRGATGGISSMAAIGGGGLTGALKPIEKANELAEKQLNVLSQIEQNTQNENEGSLNFR